MLKNYILILPKSLYSLMILILSHYTVPPKIKLTVSTGGDKQGNNIIEKMCTAKVVCTGFTSQLSFKTANRVQTI